MKKAFNKYRGFTLIELMVTVVVSATLLAVAVPGFREVIRSSRTTTNANDLVSALNLARSEAITRGVQVSLKRKGSTSQNWDGGWDVFTDIDSDGTLDDDGDSNLCESGEDCLLRTYGALPANYSLRTGANFADWAAYLPSGLSQGSSGVASDTFRLCDNQSGAATATLVARSRAISLNLSGRPMTQKGTASCP